MRLLLFVFSIVSMVTVQAQLDTDFNPKRNGVFSFYNSETKLKDWDSISFNRGFSYSGFYYTYRFKYLGQFKDNVMDGEGELRADGVQGTSFIYYGSFKDGRPHGFGHFVKYPFTNNANLIPDGRRSANSKPLYEFKGQFEEGQPKHGLFIGSMNSAGTPTIFYSGEVVYKGGNIIWQGFGSLLRTGTDGYDRTLAIIDDLGVKGSYFEGQFYNSAATGFGLANTIAENNELTGLATMLVGADMVIKVYDQFPLRTDHLVEDNILPAPVTHPSMLSLLPGLDKATFSSFTIDSTAAYRGTVVNRLPHGLGYVEYRDGFRDIGFWSAGKKVPTKAVLAALLPDATVLEPKVIEEKTTVKVPKKKKPNEFELEQMKLPVAYYAPFNAKGKPEGWGWKVNTTHPTSEPMVMKFTGEGRDELNGDSIYAQISIDEANPYYYHFNKVAVAQTSNLKHSSYRAVKGLKPVKNAIPFLRLNQLALYDDRYARIKHIAYVKGTEEAYKKAQEEWARTPKHIITKMVLYRSNPAKSFVVVNGKELYGKPIDAAQLMKGDYVFFADDLKPVTQIYDYILFRDNSSINKSAGTVYVIRNMILKENVAKLDCKVCNNRPVTTSSSAINMVSGYKTSTYNTGPNTINVISTPTLTQIGSVNKNEYCKACDGKAGMYVNQTVKEYRD